MGSLTIELRCILGDETRGGTYAGIFDGLVKLLGFFTTIAYAGIFDGLVNLLGFFTTIA